MEKFMLELDGNYAADYIFTVKIPRYFKNAEIANEWAEKTDIELILFRDGIRVVLPKHNQFVTICSQFKEQYTIRKLRESKKATMGKPLSPDDIEQLKQDETLEDVIMSDEYMLDIDDYEIINDSISDIYSLLSQQQKPTVPHPYRDGEYGISLSFSAYGVEKIVEYKFNKQGITTLVDNLFHDWDWDDERIEISINGKKISIPFNDYNCNEVAFMLKHLLIADRTGETNYSEQTSETFENLDDRRIYRIHHCYTKPEYKEKHQRFVKTNMCADELEKIYAGFEIYIEENTRYGNGSYVSEDMFARFLCEFYDCEFVTNPNKVDDSIDIYYAREGHLCELYIWDYMDSEFVRKIKAYFDDSEMFGGNECIDLSTDEIMKKYTPQEN